MLNTDTLANIVYAIRAEAGHSLSTAQGTNTIETLKYLAQRTQRELWTAYIWPTLRVRADQATAKGQYLYNFPVGMSFEQVRETWTSQATSANWTPVAYGIEESQILPGGGNTQSGDKPSSWAPEGAQFRVWPTPVTANYSTRFIGMKPLDPFIADADLSTLDSTTIALFVGAELLARAKAEDAPIKLQKAQKYLLSLLGNSISAKRRISTLASGAPTRSSNGATPYLDYLPQTN